MSINHIITVVVALAVAAGCEKKTATVPLPSPSPVRFGTDKMPLNTPAYTPAPEDTSPEGFSWVHRDFALIFSGAVYEHNFKGHVKGGRMIERKAKLEAYAGTLRKITRAGFQKWKLQHRTAFLINAYTAHLLLASIDKKFNGLDDSLLKRPGTVLMFGRKYSLEGFIRDEIAGAGKEDPRVFLALHCFSDGCPEYRNSIFNFKNLDGMLNSGVYRFFSDNDKNYYDVKTGRFRVSPYIKKYRRFFPAGDAALKEWIGPYLQHRKDIGGALAGGKLKWVF
ncbi:MAG: hypothetical protein A2583_04025 [Bdellovibrionales bacterium RIFOXYD1_FULL_53_11]|nr:MAG: hypothetical protein A2583_04025 [Bdellovibrionales bacterium RIFOXYD1_FULL_53_11]